MKANATRVAGLSGLSGSVAMLSGALVAAIFYHGRGGEAYSLFNHYISELGEAGVSTLSIAFNSGMAIGGCLMVVFMIALGFYLDTRLGWLASGAGMFSGVACCLIGVFPMNGLMAHAVVAYSFFYSGLAAVMLFILVIGLDRDRRFPKWLLAPGVACLASFSSFLIIPHLTKFVSFRTFIETGVRPRVWPVAVLEWSVFLCVIAWILVVSVYLTGRKPLSRAAEARCRDVRLSRQERR